MLDPAGQCEAAVDDAENDEHVPPRLLAAISLTETGRHDPVSGTYRPWPYSINAEGQGQFFGSAKEAIAAVRDLQARGVQSIDVGCLQVNLMYHPRAFASLEDAFDPRKNALYAAQFLVSLYTVSKDWMQAAGAYHSQTPGFCRSAPAAGCRPLEEPDTCQPDAAAGPVSRLRLRRADLRRLCRKPAGLRRIHHRHCISLSAMTLGGTPVGSELRKQTTSTRMTLGETPTGSESHAQAASQSAPC